MTLPLSRLGAWRSLPFFDAVLPGIEAQLAAETRTILPPPGQVLAALQMTQPQDVRAVILGQDPYPTPGHAHGLAFSVAPDVTPLPRSLSNIFKELGDDIGRTPPTGDLTAWARQGVLLLNTTLTVPAGEANGHSRLGWAELTRQVLAHLSASPRAFVLWGRHAQTHRTAITGSDHLMIETAHPSPLSARRGFFGSKPFSRINRWLENRGQGTIDWAAQEAI